MELPQRVYQLSVHGNHAELEALLDAHPDVDVDLCRSERGWCALLWATVGRHHTCIRLLLDHKAGVCKCVVDMRWCVDTANAAVLTHIVPNNHTAHSYTY
jgi:hypothetical protein